MDTETTGVYDEDRVVEIALVTLSLTGHVIDVYDTMVQPGRDVSASHIHGITASMVAYAPTFEEIAGDIAVRLHGACLVAHNLPFDYRMLRNEFGRLNCDLTGLPGIDTLRATRSRLGVACSTFGIDLDGAHGALADATATSQLFLQVASRCDAGSPLIAPHALYRSGKVLRREHVAPSHLPDPPLVVYLASRLPHLGAEAATLQYLEVLGRAIADLHINIEERIVLDTFASELGLTQSHIAQADRRFLNDLIDAAVSDNEVTDDEYEALVRVAAALKVDQSVVEQRVHPYRTLSQSIALSAGMTVVFTGEHPELTRDNLTEFATGLGLEVQGGVSKSTMIVAAADPNSNSGKAGKARRYGIPIVSVEDFAGARLGDIIEGHGAGQAALKVIACPDCLTTWSVPATSRQTTSKRCPPCADITSAKSPRVS